MNRKDYSVFSGFIFGVVGALHLLRVLKEWTFTINSYPIPLWVSWAAFLLTGFMAWQAYKFNR